MSKHDVLSKLAPREGRRRREVRRGTGRSGSRGARGLASAAALALLLGTAAAGLEAQQPGRVQVTGVVTSAEDGRPLPNVNVQVRGTTLGTLSNQLGRYTLTVPSLNDTLAFSLIGYAPEEVAIAGRSVVNASLAAQAVALQEIVATGYGVQQRRDVTGAIASVSGEQIARVATPSVAQALQGKVSGVQVTPVSGRPGAQAVVRIRGVGTLNNASPLFVVDGMLLDDIAFLNPNDITSMEVLKDASATAIYGSRGANGVIIITTQRGAIDRPTRFTINAYSGSQSVLNSIELVSAREYAMLANELAANQGVNPYFPNPDAVGPGTDWQNEIFQSAPMSSVQLSSSGGTDRVTYYFSANFINQAGIVPKSEFNRLTLRLNNDYHLADFIRVGHNLNFAYREAQRPPNVLGALYRADPTIRPRNEDGDFSDASGRASAGNPAATVHYTNNGEDGNRLVGNLFADVDLVRGLSLRSSFGLDHDQLKFRNFVPVFVVSPTQQNQVSNLRVENTTNSSWLWENTLNYSRVTPIHRFNLLGGITAQQFYFEELGGTRTNIAGESPALWYLNAGDADGATNFNRAEEWRMLSYLFRTNYTLLDRYLLTASLRVDGSSRFGRENRFGYFPSFALGWNLAEEAFLRDVEAISALKLRGSWGRIGNDKIGTYPAFPLVTGNLNAVFGLDESLRYGASPIALANPQVRWERTNQTNLGVDAAFFGGALEATFDWYDRLTDGILVQVPIPRYVGVASEPFVNAAEVRNRGVEGNLTWNGNLGGVGLELGANGATVRNRVESLGGGREFIAGGGWGNEVTVSTRTVVGQPIGAFWGFKVAGVFQSQEEIASSPTRGGERPGDLRYVDTNEDGRITDADRTWIGKPIPDLIYGFNTRLNYRGFDLSAAFSGQSGVEVINAKKAVRFGVENYERSFLDRWTGPGTSNREPRVTNAGHNYQASERFIEDGSFFKLQTAQLGYQLPERLATQLRAQQARLYVSGTNLFLLSGYSGYTPELVPQGGNAESVIAAGIDLGVYPPARTLTVGLDLTF